MIVVVTISVGEKGLSQRVLGAFFVEKEVAHLNLLNYKA